MSTEDGRRIYDSAEPLIARYRLNPARIEGTGKDGAVTKGDVEDYLRGGQEEAPPSQHAMTLFLATQGHTPEEIAEHVREVREGSSMRPEHVGMSIHKERRRAEHGTGSPWWEEEEVQATLAENYDHLKGVGEADGEEA